VLSDSFDEPSKVMIKASRDDIYGFQVNNPQFSELIKCMLRSLPGVLSDFVKINEETLAKKSGLTTEKVVEQLKKLESYHFVSYAPRNDKPQVLFLSVCGYEAFRPLKGELLRPKERCRGARKGRHRLRK
jgi:hypothetical protein